MDTETFKKEFLPHHQKLYRIAYRIVQDTGCAEDMVQDTFIKLWNSRNNMDNVNNTEAYAIIILRNTCLDYLRKTKLDYHPAYDIDIPETMSLSKQIEIKDETSLIVGLINKLPDKQRLVMIKHSEGYSDDEIGEITGLSPGNIRVILSRTKKIIREQFLKLSKDGN